MTYIATFFSHFGAVRYQRLCRAEGIDARTGPVPRDLSSSCGTCVCCAGAYVTPEGAAADEVDVIVALREDGYEEVYRHKAE